MLSSISFSSVGGPGRSYVWNKDIYPLIITLCMVKAEQRECIWNFVYCAWVVYWKQQAMPCTSNHLSPCKQSSCVQNLRNCTCTIRDFLRTYYRITGNFQGIQFSRLSRLTGKPRKLNPRNKRLTRTCACAWDGRLTWGAVLKRLSAKIRSWNLCIQPFRENWIPRKLPAIRYNNNLYRRIIHNASHYCHEHTKQ